MYGEPTAFPTPEDAPFPIQTSLYGASKVGAEGLLTAYAHGFGFRVKIFRFVSMLGPRYSHGHVIDFWRKLKADPTQIEVLGNGNQFKSYLHVSDAISGIFHAIRSNRAVPFKNGGSVEVYNVGHTQGRTVRENPGNDLQSHAHSTQGYVFGRRARVGRRLAENPTRRKSPWFARLEA